MYQPYLAATDQQVGVARRPIDVGHVGVEPDDIRGQLRREQRAVDRRIEGQGTWQIREAEVRPDTGLQDVLDLWIGLATTEPVVQFDDSWSWHRQPKHHADRRHQRFSNERFRPLARAARLDYKT